MQEQVIKAYEEAIYDTDRNRALEVLRDAVIHGIYPEDVVFKVVMPCLDKTIKGISELDTINLAQHFMASQIAAAATEAMTALFKQSPEFKGTMVIGTSQGDFHGLGKRIVLGCLTASMIRVIDLGVNVPPERFVDDALLHHAQVIGISSMMVHTARGENGCRRVRHLLKERGVEDRIKIIVGGAPYRFDPQLYRVVQADAWAENGVTAIEVVHQLINEVKP